MLKLRLSVALIFLGGLGLFLSPSLGAIDCSTGSPTNTQEAIQCGTDNSAGVPSGQASNIDTTIHNGIEVLSIVVGIAAVVMIIVAGARYVTSAGNDEAVKKAKSTLLYAIAGLIIVALAQIVARFVLKQTT